MHCSQLLHRRPGPDATASHKPGPTRPGWRWEPTRRRLVFILLALGLLAPVSTLRAGELAPHVCGTRHLATHYAELPLPRAKPTAGAQTPDTVRTGTELLFLVAGDAYLRAGTCQYVGEHC